MSIKWKYDACGEYCDYHNYVVIKQEHPRLDKYLICREDERGELHTITTTNSMSEFKKTIKKLKLNKM